MRLRGLLRTGDAIAALDFGDAEVALAGGDAVILAVPPWEAARLLPGIAVPTAHAPILNLHFALPVPGPVRFIGLLGGLSQWVLLRPSGIAVTVSAADEGIGLTDAEAAARIWPEVRAALRRFLPDGDWPEPPPLARAVRERRATPRHIVGPRPIPALRPLPQLALAGDWTEAVLPATLEAAVLSGETAAAAFTQARVDTA